MCRNILNGSSGLLFLLLFVGLLSAAEKENSVETLADVSIIGNSELPSVNFDFPWRLPSIENRDEQTPPLDVSDVLIPVEPYRNRQQLHFSRFLEVDTPHFKAH